VWGWVEIEDGLAGMRPKDGLDGYSSDKSEFDHAISHDERGGQEEAGPGLTSKSNLNLML